jgi:hypothetical protein
MDRISRIWAQDLEQLDALVKKVGPRKLLFDEARSTERALLNGIISECIELKAPSLGRDASDLIYGKLHEDNDLTWQEARQYWDQFPADDWFVQVYLAEILLYLYRPETGIIVDGDELNAFHSRLKYDKSGLLVSAQANIDFRKEGVINDRFFIPYAAELRRYPFSQSGGLLDQLLSRLDYGKVTNFGLAVARDIVLPKSAYRRIATEAHIRGPMGLSVEQLSLPDFPQDRTGTVTAHLRDKENPFGDPVDRFEVFWSYRVDDQKKVFQAEEVVPLSERSGEGTRAFCCRFAHAEWDLGEEVFSHFDGAVRYYSSDAYAQRYKTDIKRFGKKSDEYVKLFRIDAGLRLEDWNELLTRFFVGNELVVEYLGGPVVE